jgi:CDP-glycerol glycerophosphotransferase (TagB/SpsB family)
MSEPVKISSYDIVNQELKITFKDPSPFSNDQPIKVSFVDRQSNQSTDFSVKVERLEGGDGFSVNLNRISFKAEKKDIIDIFVYVDEDTSVRLLKSVPELKERSLKYMQTPYQIDDQNIAILYLTTKNELSILYGSKSEVYKSFCTFIEDKTFVKDLHISNNELMMTAGQINFTMFEDYYFVITKRKSNDSTIIGCKKVDNHTVALNLLSRNWSLKSRYDLFLNLKIGRVIQTLRIHIKDDIGPRKEFGLIDTENEKLKIMPYITAKGEVAFVGVDHWLYDYERSSKEILDIHYDQTSIKDNKLIISYDPEIVTELLADKQWSLEIKNSKNTDSLLIHPDYYTINNNYLEIDLKRALSPSKFKMDEKWEFYLKAYLPEQDLLEIYKLKKQSVWTSGNNQRYYKPFSLDETTDVILYISTKNDLGLLFGDKFTYKKLTYTSISSNISIEGLNFFEGSFEFRLSDIEISKIEMLRIVFIERNSKDTWTIDINPSTILDNGKIMVSLEEFVDRYQYNKSRWNVHIEIAHGNIIETGKIGCFYDELAPKHLRYYDPIATRGNTVFVPYLTIYNELSFVVNDNVNVDNERISPNIAITDFTMNQAKLKGTISIELSEVESFQINHIMLKYRGKADEDIEYKIPVIRTEDRGEKRFVTFEIDVTNYEFQPFYWDLYVLIDLEGLIYPVKVKNPSKEVKVNIDNKIVQYSYEFTNGYFIYPYISGANTLALTYREKPMYESTAYKFKENLAYYTYRIFKKYFDRKDIWLAYEKFSEGAQDNGYYFFKYCYDNNKKKDFYYIIKKDSPDYENVAYMKDKVIEFMSFRYMLLMYASKLLVSSESKGHVYDIRIQKGKLKNALTKKKHVFLQHGVTALKRVDYVFKKTQNNAVDLFVATSDYEKNIIKKYFGYNDDEIITTGFCRWDVLEDKSGEKKEIFVMPTWRTWMDDLPEEQFIESDYYKNYVGFFKSEKLKKLLVDNQVKLSFYIHPKFKTYIDSFNVENENIKIYQYGEEKVNELLMHSSMLITDYSSVAWEMYYQKKPVVFFQFDVEKYNAFQGSYLDMDTELFGDRVFTVEELENSVQEYIERDFKEKDEFASLRSKYFKYVDKKNCERTYKAIKAGLKKKKGMQKIQGNKK